MVVQCSDGQLTQQIGSGILPGQHCWRVVPGWVPPQIWTTPAAWQSLQRAPRTSLASPHMPPQPFWMCPPRTSQPAMQVTLPEARSVHTCEMPSPFLTLRRRARYLGPFLAYDGKLRDERARRVQAAKTAYARFLVSLPELRRRQAIFEAWWLGRLTADWLQWWLKRQTLTELWPTRCLPECQERGRPPFAV